MFATHLRKHYSAVTVISCVYLMHTGYENVSRELVASYSLEHYASSTEMKKTSLLHLIE